MSDADPIFWFRGKPIGEVKIVSSFSVLSFEDEIEKECAGRNVIDIQFSTTKYPSVGLELYAVILFSAEAL